MERLQSEQPKEETHKESRETTSRKSPNSLISFVGAAGVIVCLFTLAGFLGSWFWIFELTSHFRLQYCVLLITFTVAFAFLRSWRAVILFSTFALINGSVLIPFLPTKEPAVSLSAKIVRLLVWNVNSQNEEFTELTRLISEHEPDIILVMEVSSWWGHFLRTTPGYPNQHILARDDNFGIALLSKLDHLRSDTLYFGEPSVPSIHATITNDEWSLSILGTHPVPPSGHGTSRWRNEQLKLIANWSNVQTNGVVVAGDLNVTPWSPIFSEFINNSDLVNSAEGRGIHGTWPTFFKPMLIPIDHFLHSTNIVVKRRSVLNAIGSDHLPLLVEFAIQ